MTIFLCVKNVTAGLHHSHYNKFTIRNVIKKPERTNMKRIVTIGTIIVLAIMLFTSLTSSNLGFTLMMSTAVEHNIARIVLLLTLITITFTVRPRSKEFRMILAAISASITAYALAQTANYGLQIFDSLVYVLAAVILMTESLEVDTPKVQLTRVNRA